MDRLTANKNVSIEEFLDLFALTLSKAWNTGKKEYVQVYEAYPNHVQEGQFPPVMITWKYTRAINPDYKEIAPRERQRTRNEADPTKTVVVWGQRFTCTVTFEIWSYDQSLLKQANNNFTDFMVAFTPFFMQEGVGKILFLREENIEPQLRWRENLYGRSHEYRVDVEKLIPINVADISQIITEVRAKRGLDSDDDALLTTTISN